MIFERKVLSSCPLHLFDFWRCFLCLNLSYNSSLISQCFVHKSISLLELHMLHNFGLFFFVGGSNPHAYHPPMRCGLPDSYRSYHGAHLGSQVPAQRAVLAKNRDCGSSNRTTRCWRKFDQQTCLDSSHGPSATVNGATWRQTAWGRILLPLSPFCFI